MSIPGLEFLRACSYSLLLLGKVAVFPLKFRTAVGAGPFQQFISVFVFLDFNSDGDLTTDVEKFVNVTAALFLWSTSTNAD